MPITPKSIEDYFFTGFFRKDQECEINDAWNERCPSFLRRILKYNRVKKLLDLADLCILVSVCVLLLALAAVSIFFV